MSFNLFSIILCFILNIFSKYSGEIFIIISKFKIYLNASTISNVIFSISISLEKIDDIFTQDFMIKNSILNNSDKDQNYDVEVLGFDISGNIVSKEQKKIFEKYSIKPCSEYSSELSYIWGKVFDIQMKKTKSNKDYAIVDIIDENSSIKFKIWENHLKKIKNELQIGKIIVVQLKFDQFGYSLSNDKNNIKIL